MDHPCAARFIGEIKTLAEAQMSVTREHYKLGMGGEQIPEAGILREFLTEKHGLGIGAVYTVAGAEIAHYCVLNHE